MIKCCSWPCVCGQQWNFLYSRQNLTPRVTVSAASCVRSHLNNTDKWRRSLVFRRRRSFGSGGGGRFLWFFLSLVVCGCRERSNGLSGDAWCALCWAHTVRWVTALFFISPTSLIWSYRPFQSAAYCKVRCCTGNFCAHLLFLGWKQDTTHFQTRY